VSITNNLFTENGEGFGAGTVGTGVTANNNCFIDNTVGVKNYGGETIDATNNWWGSAAGPGANGVDGPVTADPFATEPVAGVAGCGGTGTQCDVPVLAGKDQVNRQDRIVSNTIVDDDGVATFTFTTLTNFTVLSIDPEEQYDKNGTTYTYNGSGTPPPTNVEFSLQAPEAGDATYFIEVEDACTDPAGPKTNNLDPPFTFDLPPEALTLDGNYPNPFRTSTTVAFSLPESGAVTVTVFDVMGREVATLVNRRLEAGPHAVRWNGTSESGGTLASGLYVVRLKAGDEVRTQRMTLVR
jgi:hypothetical protein